MQALRFLFGFHFTAYTLANIRTHCLSRLVAHEWEFTLGQVSRSRSSCGHHRPDDLTKEPPISLAKFGGRLAAPNGSPMPRRRVRLGPLGNVSTDKGNSGNWTMVANGGFEVNTEGLSFFAFFKFNGSNADGTEITGVNCSQTMLGWYRNVDRTKFGCYFADMIGTTSSSIMEKPAIKTTSPHRSFLQSVSPAQPKSSFVSSSFQIRGRRHGSQLPEEWDWRKVDGRNFLDPVIDQRECSSSYTISTIRMLSARHRIARNDSSLGPFSITFPLFCTEYNQGCNGGDAFLAAKWSNDVGLVPEACDMYNPWGSCEVDHPCVKKGLGLRADNHRYIGGFLGAMPDPDEMMRELHEKGPLVVSVNREPSFLNYKSGIYTSVPPLENSGENKMQKQDVLLVGYGQEHGQKYWIAQNSFGEKWGEQGFFRIARNRNEADIESVAVAADVVQDSQIGVLSSFISRIGEATQMVRPH